MSGAMDLCTRSATMKNIHHGIKCFMLLLLCVCWKPTNATMVDDRTSSPSLRELQSRMNTLIVVAEALDLKNTHLIGEFDILPPLVKMAGVHRQISCGASLNDLSLMQLKNLLGHGIYSNMIIACNRNYTKQILSSLSLKQCNASQLELPRVNLIIFQDTICGFQDLLNETPSLVHTIILINAQEVTERKQQNAPCTECCLPATVAIHYQNANTSSNVGYITSSCLYNVHKHFPLREVDALNGLHLTVATLEYPPFIKYAYGPGGELKVNGYVGEIFKALADKLKFSYTLVVSTDGHHGVFNDKIERWDGMIGMVVRKEADMIVVGLTISKERSEAVDFTFPFSVESVVVVIPYIDQKDAYFYKPLHWKTWLATIICTAVVGIFTWIFEIRSRKLDNVRPSYDHASSLTLFSTFSTALLKGEHMVLSTRAGRGLWFAFWFVSLVIVTAYTGNLVAALSSQHIKLPFRTLAELADDTEYTLTVGTGNAESALLENAKDGIFAKLWQKIVSRNGTKHHIIPYFKRLVDSSERLAIISERTGIEQSLYSLKQARCEWQIIPDTFLTSGFGLAVPKGSPYESLISNQLRSMSQCGLFKRWKEKTFLKSPCGTRSNRSSRVISIDYTWFIFVIIISCLILAIVVLFIEILMENGGR